MTDNLRIGIIGGGAIVQVAHLPVLRKISDYTASTMCTGFRKVSRARAIF